jgi:hypothetical protein
MAPPPYRPADHKPAKPMSKKTRTAVVSTVVIALSTAGVVAPPPFNVVARAAAAIVGLFQ